MSEPTKGCVTTLQTGMGDLVAARAVLRSSAADEATEASQIRAALSVMRRFYAAFFRDVYGADVTGFGWESKRLAVEAIVGMNADDGNDQRLADARLGVASLFEDLSDVLHGDMDFGYTDDLDLLRSFAHDYLGLWVDAVFDWLDEANAPQVKSLKAQYGASEGR